MGTTLSPVRATATTSAAPSVRPPGAPEAARERRIQGIAREFETVFLTQMLNSATSGLGDDTGFDGGHAEAQWRPTFNEEIARGMAARGGIGLAEAVARELLRAQEQRP